LPKQVKQTMYFGVNGVSILLLR